MAKLKPHSARMRNDVCFALHEAVGADIPEGCGYILITYSPMPGGERQDWDVHMSMNMEDAQAAGALSKARQRVLHAIMEASEKNG